MLIHINVRLYILATKIQYLKYKIQDQELSDVKHENYLCIIISNNLKLSDQCTAGNKKTNMNFDHKSPEVIKKTQYSSLDPHLEYTIELKPPNRIKKQNLLERVQRRETKHIPTLRNSLYEE